MKDPRGGIICSLIQKTIIGPKNELKTANTIIANFRLIFGPNNACIILVFWKL